MYPTSRIDISDEVRRTLPSPLLAVLDEIERAYGRHIPFFLVQDLGVTASGRGDPQGFVELPPQSRCNLNVMGEEIMHLHRWTRGYPAIEPKALAYQEGYAHHLQAFGGHFDEYVFFPFLESIGLDPRSELHARIVEALGSLTGGLLDRLQRVHGSGEFSAEWRVKLSRTYLVAALLSGPLPERDSLVQLFEGQPLRPYGELGRRIASEIAGAHEETGDQVAARMSTCLFTHLRLPRDTATIRYPFRST